MPQKDAAATDRVALELAQKWRLDKHLDTDPKLAGKSDRRVPSQKAVKDYVDSREPFPVGAVFTSISATNPAEVLGYGTWSAVAAGQVLMGVNPADTDFDTPGKTGGAKTLAIEDHADHKHNVTTNVAITTAVINQGAGAPVTVVTGGSNTTVLSDVETPAASISLTHKQATTGTAPMPILPPYVCVYFWLRTA